MTFLSKLGGLLAKGLAVFSGVWPLVSGLFGSQASKANTVVNTVTNDLTQIGQIIVTAEAVIQTPGSGGAKLTAAAPLVANVIKSSEILAGHKIANEALFIQGCTAITSGMADVLNSLDSSTAQTATGSAIVVPAATVANITAPKSA